MMTYIQRMTADFRLSVFFNSLLSVAAGQGAIKLAKAQSEGDVLLFSPYHNTVFALLDITVCLSVMWCMGTLSVVREKGKLTGSTCHSCC
jgi:hypothetical protein